MSDLIKMAPKFLKHNLWRGFVALTEKVDVEPPSSGVRLGNRFFRKSFVNERFLSVQLFHHHERDA